MRASLCLASMHVVKDLDFWKLILEARILERKRP